uniref:hypothetical protein n=1 Tax=Rahnella sp. RFA10(1/100) TaxID=2511202 RepID=UPI00101F5003|nr:hypothetical protein [Rahnella sp. RFA10(1/100)]
MSIESNGVVHDLKSTEFKSLIERTAALNFKLEDSKNVFDKLFKDDAEEFVKQLQRMATNLEKIANTYKKELDTAKTVGILANITALDEEVRQKLINELVEKGILPSQVVVEIERTSGKSKRKPREIKLVDINIGGNVYKFKPDGKSFIEKSFEGMTEVEVASLFKENGIDSALLAVKGKEEKANFIASYTVE